MKRKRLRRCRSSPETELARAILEEIRARDLSAYRIAQDVDLDAGSIQRFLYGQATDLRLSTASKLCAYLNLRLTRGPGRRAPDRFRRRPELRKPIASPLEADDPDDRDQVETEEPLACGAVQAPGEGRDERAIHL